jgi:uncharacterized protein (DUF427 family)
MRPVPIPPSPGQESVWDYPRPAIWEDCQNHLKVIFNDVIIAETTRAKRVLETSHPPAYYIPREDIKLDYLIETSRQTWCEWKGWCVYYDLKVGDRLTSCAAWRYFKPSPNFLPIQESYSFYASLMDACYVDGEQVQAQAGDFYGGWITNKIVGPFKGGKGTMGW